MQMINMHKYIKYLPVVLLILIFMAIFVPPELYLYIDPGYIWIKVMIWKAKYCFQKNDYNNSLDYYKKAIALCTELNFVYTKSDIFHEMEKKYSNYDQYFEFLSDILQKQFIEGKGIKYPYSVHSMNFLLNSMINSNPDKTRTLFNNIPKDILDKNEELSSSWKYVMEVTNERHPTKSIRDDGSISDKQRFGVGLSQ